MGFFDKLKEQASGLGAQIQDTISGSKFGGQLNQQQNLRKQQVSDLGEAILNMYRQGGLDQAAVEAQVQQIFDTERQIIATQQAIEAEKQAAAEAKLAAQQARATAPPPPGGAAAAPPAPPAAAPAPPAPPAPAAETGVRTCPNCGAAVEDPNAKFCPSCGQPV